MHTEVVKNISPLEKERFSFWFNEGILILGSYHHLVKENTKQRNFRTTKFYNRIGSRREMNSITEELVPLTSEIKNQALIEFHKKLSVMTWGQYKTEKYRTS